MSTSVLYYLQKLTLTYNVAPAQQSALVKRNLDLLAYGSKWSDLLVLCGEKHWYIHKVIIVTVAPSFFEMLADQADEKDRVYLGKEHNEFLVDQAMNYVYTLDFAVYSAHPKYANASRTGHISRSVTANALGHEYNIARLSEDSKAAFVAVKGKLNLHVNYHAKSGLQAEQSTIDTAWINYRAVIRGAELTMHLREDLDPVFENLFVWWLRTFVPRHGQCSEFWKNLEGLLKPLAQKAGLRRLQNGTWGK